MVLLPALVIYAPALRAAMFVLAQQGGQKGITKKVFNEVSECEVHSRKERLGAGPRVCPQLGCLTAWCPVPATAVAHGRSS